MPSTKPKKPRMSMKRLSELLDFDLAKPKRPKLQFIYTFTEFKKLLRSIKTPDCALDFETTGLHPSYSRVRLASFYNHDIWALVDFDMIRGGFEKCAPLLRAHHSTWLVFNRGFEQRFIDYAIEGDGFSTKPPSTNLLDVINLRRSIIGGGNYSLKLLLEWDLERTISKDEQNSNWAAKKLTPEQLAYAASDALHTWDLYQYWVTHEWWDSNTWGCCLMLDEMNPAVIEMEEAGLLLDQGRHRELVKQWEATKISKVAAIRALVPEAELENINSDAQWNNYFIPLMDDDWLAAWPRTDKTGQLSMKNESLKMLAAYCVGTPLETLFDALADYKTISKYLSSFGDSLINFAQLSPDGRVHGRYHIAAAKTCRFSSSTPNLQQIPRDKMLLGIATSVRNSFIAPRGRLLVSWDYSSIELRVLALLSGDTQLLEDVVFGDVHSEVAAVIAGGPIDKTTTVGKEQRTAAKGVSFGIIYGSAAAGLSHTMRCPINQAQNYIDFWEDRYPKAFAFRNTIAAEARDFDGFARMVDGGLIYFGRRPEMPKCANYPVQRAALSVMAHAISIHKERLDKLRLRSRKHRKTILCSTIHDALIGESAASAAHEYGRMMAKDMEAGYLTVFPSAPTDMLLEGGVGQTWGTLE